MKHRWFSLSLLYLAADFFQNELDLWISWRDMIMTTVLGRLKLCFVLLSNYYVLNYSQFWCNLNLLSKFEKWGIPVCLKFITVCKAWSQIKSYFKLAFTVEEMTYLCLEMVVKIKKIKIKKKRKKVWWPTSGASPSVRL